MTNRRNAITTAPDNLPSAPPPLQRGRRNAMIGQYGRKVTDLTNLLKNKQWWNAFYKFCVQEFSAENISCWTEINDFQNNPSIGKAEHIYSTYLRGAASPKEVNIPKFKADNVKSALEGIRKDPRIDYRSFSMLFDEIMMDIMMNLSDTYSRFIFTAAYKDVMAKNRHL